METVRERGLAAAWQLDSAHSEVGFSVRHLMIANVRGRFQDVRTDLRLDENDLTRSTVAVEIGARSIDTGVAQRDEHLRSPDFFDAENHPTIRFASSRVEQESDDRYRVIGDLTIRGVTREVTLNAELRGPEKDPWGGERLGVTATTKIDRRDFGLTWNQALEAGGLAVAHDVAITIELELIRQ